MSYHKTLAGRERQSAIHEKETGLFTDPDSRRAIRQIDRRCNKQRIMLIGGVKVDAGSPAAAYYIEKQMAEGESMIRYMWGNAMLSGRNGAQRNDYPLELFVKRTY